MRYYFGLTSGDTEVTTQSVYVWLQVRCSGHTVDTRLTKVSHSDISVVQLN